MTEGKLIDTTPNNEKKWDEKQHESKCRVADLTKIRKFKLWKILKKKV